jgi:hypothetical protein
VSITAVCKIFLSAYLYELWLAATVRFYLNVGFLNWILTSRTSKICRTCQEQSKHDKEGYIASTHLSGYVFTIVS